MSRHALLRSVVLATFMLFNGLIIHADKPESFVTTRRVILTSWKPKLFVLRHVDLTLQLQDHCFTDSLAICISSRPVPGDPVLAVARKQRSHFVSTQSESWVDTRRIILPSWKPKLHILRRGNLTFPLGDYNLLHSLLGNLHIITGCPRRPCVVSGSKTTITVSFQLE